MEEFRGSPKDIQGSEETIENIEEFIDANNIKTSQLMGTDIETESKIAGSRVHYDPTVKDNTQGMMSYSNNGVENLPVMLCPVTGLVYSEGDVPSGE